MNATNDGSEGKACQWCARTDPHEHEVQEQPKRERAKAQIERLAAFILAETDGPEENEGVVDAAIRLIQKRTRQLDDSIALAQAYGRELIQYQAADRQNARALDVAQDECARLAGELQRLKLQQRIREIPREFVVHAKVNAEQAKTHAPPCSKEAGATRGHACVKRVRGGADTGALWACRECGSTRVVPEGIDPNNPTAGG